MHRFRLASFFILSLIFTDKTGILNAETNRGNEKTVIISERIVLNTDRKVYIAGENILFSLFLIDKHARALASYPSIGYIIIRNQAGTVIGKSQVKIKEGKATGGIYLSDTLKSGYYQIVAYTNFMRNGSDDIFFKSQIIVANRFDRDFFDVLAELASVTEPAEVPATEIKPKELINVSPSQLSFHKRSKASLKINIKDPGVKFVDFSISIVEKNTVEATLSKKASISLRDSRAYVVGPSNSGKPIYLAEDKYGELLGRLTDISQGYGIGYHVLYLSSPDSITNFRYTITDAEGYFRFPLTDYYNGKDLFIKIKQSEAETLTAKITMDPKFQCNEEFVPVRWPIDSSFINYLKNSQDIVKVQKSFSQIHSQYQPIKFDVAAPVLYKVPDFTVKPSDYADLKDFQEISREIIPDLKVRKHEEQYTAEILDFRRKQFLPPDPVIFLDGVLIDNVNQIINLGTKDIRKIEGISSKWIVDHQELSGVVNVSSYNNLWKTLTLSPDNLRIKAENYYEAPQNFAPDYSLTGQGSREPDFRQQLYWNPHYHLNAGDAGLFEFYTSDYATSYLIKVEGINDKGEKFESYSEMEVKK